MINIFVTLICSVVCGLLGRMGGSGNYPRQARIVGIPAIACILAYILGCHSWLSLALSFSLMAGAISTYWDFLFHDVDNFFMHGAVIALSLLPIAFPNHWLGFASAVALYTLWMGLWSKFTTNVVWEECGRYAIIPIGIYLLYYV